MIEKLANMAKPIQNATSFVAIALPGAIGGLVTWLLDLYPQQFGIFKDPLFGSLLSMTLGAAAGLTAIVVLTNSDRNDKPRLVTLSFLAGIVWISILPAGLEAMGVATSPFDFNKSYDSIQSVIGTASAVSKTLEGNAKTTAQENVDTSVTGFLENARRTPEFRDQMISTLVDRVHETLSGPAKASVFAALRRAGIDESDLRADSADSATRDHRPADDSGFLDTALFANPLERILPNRIDSEDFKDLQSLNEIVVEPDLESNSTQKHNLNLTTPENETWLRLRVPKAGIYTIQVEGRPELDLTAVLYASDRVLDSANDDSDDDLNPEITTILSPGEYFLRISDLLRTVFGNVDITFIRRTEG